MPVSDWSGLEERISKIGKHHSAALINDLKVDGLEVSQRKMLENPANRAMTVLNDHNCYQLARQITPTLHAPIECYFRGSGYLPSMPEGQTTWK